MRFFLATILGVASILGVANVGIGVGAAAIARSRHLGGFVAVASPVESIDVRGHDFFCWITTRRMTRRIMMSFYDVVGFRNTISLRLYGYEEGYKGCDDAMKDLNDWIAVG